MKKISQKMLCLWVFALVISWSFLPSSAYAQQLGFRSIASNIVDSIGNTPILFNAAAYLSGLLFAIVGIIKIKRYTDNPDQNPLKNALVHLFAAGLLLAFPFTLNAIQGVIGYFGNGIYFSDIELALRHFRK